MLLPREMKKSIWTDEHATFPQKKRERSGPCGIAVDSSGNVFYTNLESHTLFQIQRSGKIVRNHFADAKAKLAGLVYAGQNRLYICDITGRILQFDIATKKFHIIGRKPRGHKEDDGPLSIAQFYSPRGIDIDTLGNLYVTDGNRIRKISMQQRMVETIAGHEKSGYVDGPVSSARFSRLVGITIKQDEIVVADSVNNRIRKIQNGIVSTIKMEYVNSPSAIACNFNGKLLVLDKYYLKAEDKGNMVYELPRKYSFDLSTIQSDHRGNLFIGGNTIAHFQETWKWERLLWIGKLKESSDCWLARLPSELIMHIASFTKCACPE